MKRPEKVVKWLTVSQERREPFLDHNGKPLFKYFIELPYWLAKAYKPFYVKVEIGDDQLSYTDRIKDENKEEVDAYIKANWSKKLHKMRKMNHNYVLVSIKGVGSGCFKSIKDYEDYHKELQLLDEKYGLSPSALKSKESEG